MRLFDFSRIELKILIPKRRGLLVKLHQFQTKPFLALKLLDYIWQFLKSWQSLWQSNGIHELISIHIHQLRIHLIQSAAQGLRWGQLDTSLYIAYFYQLKALKI